MGLQNFIDKSGPAVSAAWLNVVDAIKFTVFADATTKANARTALTSDAPLEVANGGTGVRTIAGMSFSLGAFGQAVTIAGAATTDLGGAASHEVLISGSGASISSLGGSAAATAPIYLVRFLGAHTLVNGAALIIPGGSNISTAAGDSMLVEYLGSSNWRVWAYWLGTGILLTGNTVGTFGTKVTVASATTTNLGAVANQAHVIDVSGTTTITSFGSGASTAAPIYIVNFTGSLQITAGSGITLPYGETSIQTKANDSMVLRYDGSGNWTVLGYLRKNFVPTIRNVAGTTDSPTAVDAGNIVTLSSASPTVVTLNGSIIPVGESIAFFRLGAGSVTFAPGTSQTINSPGSRLTIPEQYGTVVATYRAVNTWILGGV